MKKINTPLKNKDVNSLKAGEEVFFSGIIYTARDQAHKRLTDAIISRRKLPIDLNGQIIYYCGPTPTPKGKIIGTSAVSCADGEQGRQGRPRRTIGSCGPTTSSRMDEFTPLLLKAGLKGMIGKGARSKEVIDAIKKYKAVYFVTYAGCGALLSTYVKSKKLVCFKSLGPEAIYELEVESFPLIVAIDTHGRSIYPASPFNR